MCGATRRPSRSTGPERVFAAWAEAEAAAGHDPDGLDAEANTYRLRPLPGGVALRCGSGAETHQVEIAAAAADAAGARLIVSRAAGAGHGETDEAFAARLPSLGVDRLRLVGTVDPAVRRAAHAASIAVDDLPPVSHPDIELPRWFREQTVSRTLHRHGHLPASASRMQRIAPGYARPSGPEIPRSGGT